MSRSVAAVIGAGLATLYELQTIYGAEDLQDLLEIAVVDGENKMRAARHGNAN